MNKFRGLLMITIALLCSSMLLNYATARPDTTLAVAGDSLKTQLGVVEENCNSVGKPQDGCTSIGTLAAQAAHVDYIYTQDGNP